MKDIKFVREAHRMLNSRDGNPRWTLIFGDNTKGVTGVDAMVGHKISTSYEGCWVIAETHGTTLFDISYPFHRDATWEQVRKITELGGDPEDFRPDFSLPDGWLMGTARGITYGVNPAGEASS